jgi:hypothetical protein
LYVSALLPERRAPFSRKKRFSHKNSVCSFKCVVLCTRFYPGTPTSSVTEMHFGHPVVLEQHSHNGL